jgi:RNA polymerase sigma factor (sigma-70 family)
MEGLARLSRRRQIQYMALPALPEYHSYPEKKRRLIDYKESLEAISPVAEKNTVYNDDALRLRQAVRLLSETDRAIISMHLDGYDNGEIAVTLGISNNHVAVKLHRSKDQLANLLKHI